MFKYAPFIMALFAPLSAHAASDEDLRNLGEQIKQLQDHQQQRILQLEQQLQQNVAAPPQNVRPPGSAAAFNPAISLILGGTYGNLKQDPAMPATGFAMSANPGHEQGFNLGESELVIEANIDPQFRGVGVFAVDPAGGISAEEANVQTSALGEGLTLKMGRFFSGLGYLNSNHSHTWDFVDQPLVYAALWDNQLSEDGVQIKWLTPAAMFIEIGGEIGRGRGFPGTDRVKNGSGAGVLFAHMGDDIGIEHNWLAGVSLHQTKRVNAISDAVPDMLNTAGGVSNSFTGDSRTTGLDFIWKYAPNGNTRETHFKFLGEYFRRKENGLLTYNNTATDSYTVTQSGWYVQSTYQFVRRWRAGLRYDRLDSGTAQVGALNITNVASDYHYSPTRKTLMLDYSPSEFSRLRLQLVQDNSRQGLPDRQLFVQYIMSIGAHGAHQY